MSVVVDVLSAFLLLSGAVVTLISAVGLFRVPDAYGRLHVATKPATLGIACTLAGATLQVPFGSDTSRLVLALALQFWTIPVSSHLLGRAARATGLPPARPDVLDEFPTDGPPRG
ncbi:MAG: monovalent cation/H(+) antiporter subunit G [Microthrixaceae bacterium]